MSAYNTIVTLAAQFSDIWVFTEEKMRIKIPLVIKHILELCGYDNCYSIATIEDRDIDYIANEVRKGKLGAEMVLKESVETIKNFEFTRGHRKLIMAIAKFVKTILDSSGANGVPISVKQTKTNNKNGNIIHLKNENLIFSIMPIINQENYNWNVKANECQLHSSAIAQLDSKIMSNTLTHEVPHISASTFFYHLCSSHALSQIFVGLKILSDEVENDKCCEPNNVNSITSLPDVTTSAKGDIATLFIFSSNST